MPELSIVAGATSQSINIDFLDNSRTDDGGLTAVAPAGGALMAGVICYYSFTGSNAAAVSVSLSVLATVGAAYSSGGIVTLDDTHMPGVCRFDIPNAALATGKGRQVVFVFSGGANMVQKKFYIELTGWDNQNATTGGLTNLDATVSSRLAASSYTAPPSTTAIATAIWQDATAGDFTVASSIGKSLYTSGNAPGAASGLALVGSNMGTVSGVTGLTTATIATAVWTDLTSSSDFSTASSIGLLLKTDINAPIGSIPTSNPTAAQIATAVWQDTTAGDFTVASSIGKSLYTSGAAPGAASGLAIVGSNMGTVTSVTGSVGSISGVTFPSGFSTLTTAAIATATWQDATAGDFATASSIGKALFVNAAPGAASGHAIVGSQMDLVNAPNATAITAIQSGLALAATALSTANWTNTRATNLDNLDRAITAILTTAMTESYAAKGATMSAAQALYLLQAWLTNLTISGTTYTALKLDGTTTAATGTLDSSTAPTQNKRAT